MDAHELTRPLSGALDPLTEREVVLSATLDAIADARAGRGSALAVHGSAGLGKSRLLSALTRAGEQEGLTTLAAGGRELEQGFVMGVVLQLFESHLAGLDEDERGRMLSGPARETTPLFASGPAVLAEQPFSLLHGLFRLCANLSATAPLLLVVDDVGQADPASLRFLLYLLERVEQLPVVVLLSHGGAVRPADPELLDRVVGHPQARSFELEPFTRSATARRLREAWFPDADDELCDAVHEVTAGRPDLVDQLGEALATGSATSLTPAGVRQLGPASVAATTLRRARVAGSGGPELMRAAAVLGDRAELRHAAVLAGLELEAATPVVGELATAGLLVRSERLSTTSPLLRSALEQNEAPTDLADAHLRAARLLAEEEEAPERVAAHLLRSARTGSGWAVEALCAAASVALARGVPGEAAGYLRRALEEPPPPELRAQVVLELGRADTSAGEARGDAGAGPTAALPGEPAVARGEAVPAPLHAGRTLLALGRRAEAVAAFERGLADDPDENLAARLRFACASAVRLGRPLSNERPGLGAVPQRSDSPADRGLLALQAFEGALRGEPSEVVRDLAGRALARGVLLEDETADGLGYYLPVLALVVAEDLQAAEAALTAAIEDARSRGSLLGFATASCFRSLAIYRRGRVPDAVADARQAVGATRNGWRLAVPATRAVLAAGLLERGDLAGASRQLALAEKVADLTDVSQLSMVACRGELRLAEGRPEQALADFRSCGDRLTAAGISNPALIGWRSGAARASAALGDRAEARRLAEEELGLARAARASGPAGRALRALATVSEPQASLELLDEAVQTLQDSQAALERARALVDFGAALRRSGRRRAARDPLRDGLDLAQRCGAEVLAARALREAKVAGARPRRTALHGREALTTRERQVAELAVAGLSNREISETLFVTVKTVEWHLKHTYRKLGVTSRSGLPDALGQVEESS